MSPKKRSEEIININNLVVDTHNIARNDLFTIYTQKIHIKILDHGYFWGDLKWNRFDVVSPYSRLYFVHKHGGWLETKTGDVPLEPGKMYLVPPYFRINLRTKDKIEKFYYHFTTRFDGIEIFEDLGQCLVLDMDESLLNRYLHVFESEEIADLLKFKSLIYETVAIFMKKYLPDLKNKLLIASKYKEIHKYIDSNLSMTLSAKSVSQALGISHISVSRSYSMDTGITLNKYIRSRIIYKSIDLLLHTDMRIKEIAGKLGFVDEFYFSRYFKKEMEYSPREYRRINKK